jgi:hypothetical protein
MCARGAGRAGATGQDSHCTVCLPSSGSLRLSYWVGTKLDRLSSQPVVVCSLSITPLLVITASGSGST